VEGRDPKWRLESVLVLLLLFCVVLGEWSLLIFTRIED